MIIAITGTPGVGKSTVSNLLFEKLKSGGKDIACINITEVVSKNGLYLEKDIEMDSYVVDFDKLNKYIQSVGTEDLILDGHVSHYLNPDYIIVLRANPLLIKNRLESRNYSSEKVKENVEAELLDVCLVESIEKNDESKIFEIDCSEKDPEKIVNEILMFLDLKNPEYGNISWLEDYFYLIE
ncbi:adenylate kinase family protein [Methanococcus maripaludis]|uniref:Putative adenylate kinase n=2 Tax=Methanococcus maripaludis TaxID=39152 RepID=KAD6_METM7|nr:AAA family ATPase [Methanococcus maripaludis]A6VHC3.1 RecName: Full=Putative adenylate kinase; Short=AK; AltName: Full=ATP-AMP transphosphorylase [Methanococcus maripaludis C7]